MVGQDDKIRILWVMAMMLQNLVVVVLLLILVAAVERVASIVVLGSFGSKASNFSPFISVFWEQFVQLKELFGYVFHCFIEISMDTSTVVRSGDTGVCFSSRSILSIASSIGSTQLQIGCVLMRSVMNSSPTWSPNC